LNAKRKLTGKEKDIFRMWFPESVLEVARIKERAPWFLPKSFYGITFYNVIHLREYDPGNVRNLAMLGHELIHVKQYAEGMTVWSYLSSCLGGYMKSLYEIEAYDMERKIREFLEKKPSHICNNGRHEGF
jgi:hypothetical protein